MFNDLNQKNSQGNQAAPEEGQGSMPAFQNQAQSSQPDTDKPDLSSGKFVVSEKQASPPMPESKEAVEDIFSKTDVGAGQGEKPDVFKPKEPQDLGVVGGQRPTEWQDSEKPDKMKKFFVLAVVIVGLVIILAGGFWIVNKFFNKTDMPPASDKAGSEENIKDKSGQDVVEPIDDSSVKEFEQEIIKPLDSDQDGLTDDEERELGTDINSVDSDNDGLFDREEVKVYKTDPLNADTDGDGYLDGAEVKEGYNPNGAGRLYEIR